MSADEDPLFLLFSHPEGLVLAAQRWPDRAGSLAKDRRTRAKQICREAFPEKRFGAASVKGAAEDPGLHVVAVPADIADVSIGMSVDELLPILTRDRYVAFVEFA